MVCNFIFVIEIVLGYSNYEKVLGWFNKKIIFDMLLNFMCYLGMVVFGYFYMGIGWNMVYWKMLYYK